MIRTLLALEWTVAPVEQSAQRNGQHADIPLMRLDKNQIEELIALGSIGYVRGIESKLASLQASAPDSGALLNELGGYIREFQFKRYLDTLEGLRKRDY